MAFDSTFVDIPVDRLHAVAQEKHDEGFRFVQMLCRMADELARVGVDDRG